MTAVAIGLFGIAMNDPQARTPATTERRVSSSTPSAYLSPITITYTEPTPCNVSRPRLQSHARVRPVKVHRKPKVIHVRVKPRRTPLPSTLAELVHPARCEVVHRNRFYEPVDLIAPARPILTAFRAPAIPGLYAPAPILIDRPLPGAEGPSLFPDLGPIIAGGPGPKRQSNPTTTIPDGPGLVSGAPEPAEWALYTVGLGLAGLSLRLGRKLAAKPAEDRD